MPAIKQSIDSLRVFTWLLRNRTGSLLSLAYPIILSQLGSIILGWADTVMVGQYGIQELSAASFVNNIFNLVIFFLLGFSYAATPVVGDYFSKEDFNGVLQVRRSCILVNLIASLFIVALLAILYFNIESLKQPQELLPIIKPYFSVLLFSLPFLAVSNALKQCSEAIGDTKTPMWLIMGSIVLNVVLNYLLIYGRFGLPELGLVGAGVATLISRVTTMLSLLLFRNRKLPRVQQKLEWSFHDSIRLTNLGIPIGMQLCVESGSFNVCAIFMGWIGATALAAHQVMCTIGAFGFMIYYGIGAAAAIRIAYYKGRNEWNEVKATAQTSLYIALCFSGVIVSVICLYRTQIASLFTTSIEVTTLFISFLPAFICYQVGDCMQTIYANSLRAIEDVKYLMLYAFISYGILTIPLAYIFAFSLNSGATGVWWSFPIGLTTAGLLFFLRFQKTCKKYCKGIYKL